MQEPYLRSLIVEEARGGPEPAVEHSHFTIRYSPGSIAIKPGENA